MNKLDLLFRAFHIFGALMWVGGMFAVMAFLDAHAQEPDAAARGRLAKHVRIASFVPRIGATIALLFGLHWLFKFKLYEAHYMHPKLALVAVMIGVHGFLEGRVKKVKAGEMIAEWDPYTIPILTETGGVVKFGDIVEGITMEEKVDERTGLSTKVIVDTKDVEKRLKAKFKK